MSERSDYFSLAAVVLVVASAVIAITTTLYAVAHAQNKPFSLWTSGGMIFAYVLALLALALVWLGLTDRPFPPWKRLKFPDLAISVIGYEAKTGDPKEVWLAYRLRVTNREKRQPANLTISYRAKVKSDELRHLNPRGEDWGETPFVSPSGTPPNDFPTDWLAETVNIQPQHTAVGYYVAMLEKFWWDNRSDPIEESLLIEDHVSNLAIYIPAALRGRPITSSEWDTPVKDSAGWWTIYPPSASAAPNSGEERSS
jgi:hypothetical protein